MFRCDEVKNRAAASRSSLRTRMLYANPVTSEFRVIQIGESEHGPAGLFCSFAHGNGPQQRITMKRQAVGFPFLGSLLRQHSHLFAQNGELVDQRSRTLVPSQAKAANLLSAACESGEI
jgi:hypothetical protein